MQRWLRIAIIGLFSSSLLGACNSAQTQSIATSIHQSEPNATLFPSSAITSLEPTFAPGSVVAGIDVGQLTVTAATTKLQKVLSVIDKPFEIHAGKARLTVDPKDIDLQTIDLTDLIDDARRQIDAGSSHIQTPLQVTFDRQALHDQLTGFAAQITLPSTLQVLTSTVPFSRSFAYTPSQTFNVASALRQIEKHLQSPPFTQSITLELETDPPPPVQSTLIKEQITAMAQEWDGIVGFYLYDLTSGETVTLNENTVFSGASVMKVPIMLQAYTKMKQFEAKHKDWLGKMIVSSDNLTANSLLAASIDGQGTEDALEGVLEMNAMLRRLGLKHTYQNLPYEAYDYLVKIQGMQIKSGPAQEGASPYTEADPMVRTTPAEMVRIFLLLDQCSHGEGDLLTMFKDTLSAKRCQEMLDWLEQNDDDKRIVAGLPDDVRVEHKSGWVEDMQSDVGIIRSPGGDFILAIYLYQKNDWLRDEVAAPVIAAFAHMVYTAYNPIRLDR